MTLHPLENVIAEKIQASPSELILKLHFENQTYWIKQRPSSKKSCFHYLQAAISRCLPFPILKPTVSLGGKESILQETERLRGFHENNIPAAEVILHSDVYLVTKDCGIPLQTLLKNTDDDNLREAWLQKAVESLHQVHQAGLCHGRPSSKDLLVNQDSLFWIDLEEDPLSKMSLEEAQARDVWLLLIDLAKYTRNKHSLENLCRLAIHGISSEVSQQLHKLIKILRPIRQILQFLPAKILGKEVQRAMEINKALEVLTKPH